MLPSRQNVEELPLGLWRSQLGVVQSLTINTTDRRGHIQCLDSVIELDVKAHSSPVRHVAASASVSQPTTYRLREAHPPPRTNFSTGAGSYTDLTSFSLSESDFSMSNILSNCRDVRVNLGHLARRSLHTTTQMVSLAKTKP